MIRHTVLALCAGIAVYVLLASSIPAESSPAGTLFEESFDDAKLKERKWYDLTRITIVGDAARGKGCIEYDWPDRTSRGTASAGMRRLFKPTDEVYLRFYLKLSKGWGWTGRNYHPHLTHFLTTENPKWHGPAASHLTLYIEPVNGKLRLAAQDIQNQDMPHGLTQGPLKGGYNGKFYESREVLFKDDRWHCVEARFKLNTLDLRKDRPNRDGIVQGWFDGKLVIDHANVILRSTDFPKMKFNHFLMAPYFGPGLLPHAQKLWIDELVVGTERIGPLTLSDDAREEDDSGDAEPYPPKVMKLEKYTNFVGMRFVKIPAGTFTMGAKRTVEDDDRYGALVGHEDESPAHEVRITKAFYFGEHEVTYGEFESLDEAKKMVYPKKHRWYSVEDDEPANVSYAAAVEFCRLMTAEDSSGVRYRLPTEAEWEYAARGALEEMAYPWGNVLNGERACYGARRVRPVGSFPPNAYGLYDMAGNVWEWTGDWYRPDFYEGSPRDDPKGPPDGLGKVIRGGAFYDNELLLRVSVRDWITPSEGAGTCGAFGLAPYGFRVVAELSAPVDENGSESPSEDEDE